jgi:hypothetical protein
MVRWSVGEGSSLCWLGRSAVWGLESFRNREILVKQSDFRELCDLSTSQFGNNAADLRVLD